MIVTCKACATKYQVAEKDLASKTLRCGQCEHTWLCKAKSMQPRVRHEILYLKARYQHPKNFLWIRTLASTLLCTALLLSLLIFQNFWIRSIPISSEVYDFVGLPSIQGCVLQNVYALKTQGQVELNGIIKNTATTRRRVPKLKIFVLYQDTKTPQALLINPPERYLSQHQQYFFHHKIPETDRRIKSIVVEIAVWSDDFLHSLTEL